jgi:putative nucleotidyltransferase with HDIG domain
VPRLRVRDGPNRGLVHQVTEKPILVGRDTDCTIQVLDKGASRHHAEIFRVGQMCFIRDLGSRNGTYVNDERVHEELLREGDRVIIGSTTIVFETETEVRADSSNILFTEARDEELGSTLELRLDDLAGLDESEDRDTANFRAIYQLGRMLASERSVEAAQEKALAFLAEIIPAEQVYLFARDEQTGALAPRARFERDPSVPAQVSRTIIKRCLRDMRSMLTTNAMSDARFKSTDSIVLGRIRSVICVPMVSLGDVSGVLYVSSSRIKEVFVEEDLELVTAAATLLGLTTESLESARRQRETFFGAMRSLVTLMEARDPARRGHSQRVAGYSEAMGRQLGLSERERTSLRLAALLHDVGKAGVPADALDGKETGHLRRGDPGTMHAVVGGRIADSIAGAEELYPAIRHHHEAYDGSGYPDGLSGEAIPLPSRIIAAADLLDHITNSGVANEGPVPIGVAVELLNDQAGRKLDPEIVRVAVGAFKSGLLQKQEPVPAGEALVAEGKAEVKRGTERVAGEDRKEEDAG